MKKVLFVAIAVLLCFGLIACSATPAAEEPAADAPAAEEPAAEEPAAEEPAAEEPAAEEPAEEPDAAPEDAGGVKKVAVSLPPADNAWQASFAEFINDLLSNDPNIEATIKSSTDGADQMNVLQTFKDGDYDLITVLPVDGSQLTATVEEIYDSGIPVIVCDRDIESDKKTSFVASDSYSCGVIAAEYIMDFFADKEEVKLVNLRSYTGTPIDLARYNGFMDTIAGDEKFVMLGESDGEFNSTAGFEAMSNLLAAHPEIDCVYTHDDETTTGALTAIEQQERDDIQLITGMGGTVTALNEIKADNTPHKMTSSFFPGISAEAVYEAISTYLTTGSVDKEIIKGADAITKDNVDDFMKYAYE